MKRVYSEQFTVYSVFLFLTLLTVYSTIYTVCFAQPILSTELINNAKQYDGKTVIYEGEVIGDIMVRGNYAWININDGNSAIGVWMNKSFTKDILYTGSYKSKGDGVKITGIFHRACPEHGGDLDIHAQAIRRINSGRIILEKLNPGKRNQVIVLLGFLSLVCILSLLKRK